MTPINDADLKLRAAHGGSGWLTHQDGGWAVPGVVLEGAWAVGQDILCATTDDVPYEEALHFSLLGPHQRNEHLTLGAAYATGIFAPLDVRDRTLLFRFFGSQVWSITVDQRPRVHLPFLNDPPGVRRTLSLRTRLRISILRKGII